MKNSDKTKKAALKYLKENKKIQDMRMKISLKNKNYSDANSSQVMVIALDQIIAFIKEL